MKKIGIIGLGVISQNYLRALQASPYFSLTAVSDVNEQAKSRALYQDYPFYTDYITMIENEGLDFVLISTPPATHYEIAKACMERKVNIIMEKPAVLDLQRYDELLAIAKANAVEFEVMYHFQNGSETLAFLREYDVKKIRNIRVTIMDGYSLDGVSIVEDRRILQGAWLDSGVNALSQLNLFLPFKNVYFISAKKQLCPVSNLPIFVDVRLKIDNVPVEITVDWRKNINRKITHLEYDNETLILHNSNQSILYNGQEISYATMPRLEAHYYNYFQNYQGVTNEQNSRRIHEILLDVNARL